jgi:drug/metabolite transporter (DMT)-like permease
MGIVHSTIAPILYFKGLQSITAQKAAVLGYFEPVGAILLAVLIFGESPSGMAVIGGILILTSGYIAITKRI